jgi:hypothetical protein
MSNIIDQFISLVPFGGPWMPEDKVEKYESRLLQLSENNIVEILVWMEKVNANKFQNWFLSAFPPSSNLDFFWKIHKTGKANLFERGIFSFAQKGKELKSEKILVKLKRLSLNKNLKEIAEEAIEIYIEEKEESVQTVHL